MNRTQSGRCGAAGRVGQVAWSADPAAAIRPVRPADRPALADFFAALSAQTLHAEGGHDDLGPGLLNLVPSTS